MIHVKKLNYRIGNTTILHDINFTLPKQQLSAIIGPNGAGKSTLMNLIARLYPLQEGEILIDGLNLRHTDNNTLAKKISILQQQTKFLSRLSVNEMLLFARYPYHKGNPKKADRDKIEEICGYFNLHDYRHRFIDELSGGQRQRALVAMVFAQETDVILLDEPLNNLDMLYSRQLMQTLRMAVDDWHKTIAVVLHDINYAAYYADHITALKNGEIFTNASTTNIINAETISNLYDIDVDIINYKEKPICVHF